MKLATFHEFIKFFPRDSLFFSYVPEMKMYWNIIKIILFKIAQFPSIKKSHTRDYGYRVGERMENFSDLNTRRASPAESNKKHWISRKNTQLDRAFKVGKTLYVRNVIKHTTWKACSFYKKQKGETFLMSVCLDYSVHIETDNFEIIIYFCKHYFQINQITWEKRHWNELFF